MKNTMENTNFSLNCGERELRKMRDHEFLVQYRQTVKQMLEQGQVVVRKTAVMHALAAAKPLFYVSFHRAQTVMWELFYKGGLRTVARTERQAMWLDLYGKVKAEMQKHPNLSMPQALARTLYSARADRLYLNPSYAYKLLYRIQQNNKRKNRLNEL